MNAIILAAGLGSRLRPLTDHAPKCLTPVVGTPIIQNALQLLAACDVAETIVVVGYLGDVVRATVGHSVGAMRIRYVENPAYATTSTSASLAIGLRAVEDRLTSLLILEGDVYFEKRLLLDFIGDDARDATVVEAYHPPLDGSFVALDGAGGVIDWIHTTHRGPQFRREDKYKTVNIHKFNSTFVHAVLAPSLQRRVAASEGAAPIEYVFRDVVITNPGHIHAFQTNGRKWYEIDDHDDLMRAEEIFAPHAVHVNHRS